MKLYPTLELWGQGPLPTQPDELEDRMRDLRKLGFSDFYIIDRDAQFSDRPFNLAEVEKLIKANPDLSVWVGGGLKDIETIDAVFEAGAARVVAGPMLWRQEGLFQKAAAKYPGQIMALIEARHGMVTIFGTRDISRERIMDAALRLESEGAAGIVYLEREREGFYGGIDTEIMADLAFALGVPLYVTGGINMLNDLKALKAEAHTGIAGVILGKALLDGRIDPVSALTLLREKT